MTFEEPSFQRVPWVVGSSDTGPRALSSRAGPVALVPMEPRCPPHPSRPCHPRGLPYHLSDTVLLLHLHFQALETFLHAVVEGPQVLRHPLLVDLNPGSQEGDLERKAVDSEPEAGRRASVWTRPTEQLRSSACRDPPRAGGSSETFAQGRGPGGQESCRLGVRSGQGKKTCRCLCSSGALDPR